MKKEYPRSRIVPSLWARCVCCNKEGLQVWVWAFRWKSSCNFGRDLSAVLREFRLERVQLGRWYDTNVKTTCTWLQYFNCRIGLGVLLLMRCWVVTCIYHDSWSIESVKTSQNQSQFLHDWSKYFIRGIYI